MIVRRTSDGRLMRVIAVTDQWRETPTGPRKGRIFWVRPPKAREDFPLEQLLDQDCTEVPDDAL